MAITLSLRTRVYIAGQYLINHARPNTTYFLTDTPLLRHKYDKAMFLLFRAHLAMEFIQLDRSNHASGAHRREIHVACLSPLCKWRGVSAQVSEAQGENRLSTASTRRCAGKSTVIISLSLT